MASFTGPQKTAIVMLALGEKFTAEAFKRMERQEIALVSKAMLDIDSVSRDDVIDVLKEFNDAITYGAETLTGGADQVKRLLTKALDSETAKYILDSLELDPGPTPFQELSTSARASCADPQKRAPQTLALILGNCTRTRPRVFPTASECGPRCSCAWPAGGRGRGMLHEVDKVLQSQLIAMGARRQEGGRRQRRGRNPQRRGPRHGRGSALRDRGREPADGRRHRNLMFVFEDIKGLDDRSIRELLKDISNEELTKG